MLTQTATVPTVTFMLPVKSDWQTGFDLYIAGESESACKNTAQIAGWWAALDAEAACSVCDRMAEAGKTPEDMDAALDGMTFDEWRYGI